MFPKGLTKMSSCKRNEARIHRLVENELNARQEAELRRHITSCERCSKILHDYMEMKTYTEEKLASEINLPDEVEFVIAAAAHKKMKRDRHIVKKALKFGFMTAAAGLAMIALGGFLFFKLYFGRTFAREIPDSVLRCSSGLKIKDGNAEWAPLKAAQRLKQGSRLLTPEGARSFVSFNGIRLLSGKSSEFEIKGSRKLFFVSGDIAIESDRRKEPLEIRAGSAVLSTGDSSVRISGQDDFYSIACISGTARLSAPGGDVQQLAAGQMAMVMDERVRVSSSFAENMFAYRRVHALERIKERFYQVMAKYSDRIPSMRLGRGRYPHSFGPQTADWGNGLQCVSYMGGGFSTVANDDVARSAADYYESLFLPGNRSITIGRQKVVPLEPFKGASFPRWSNDGSMIAFIETHPGALTGIARVVRVDDLDHPWDISQEYSYAVRSMLPEAWSPDDRRILFQVETGPTWDEKGPTGNFKLVLAPVNPDDGPVEDFVSPFYDIPLPLPLPVGKTISPSIAKLPWGDAMVCSNWGNLTYIPVEEDGQAVGSAQGIFLTNFNPRHVFVMGGGFSPSGSMMDFTAAENLNFNRMNSYILYEVDDILDGFAEPPRSLDDPRIKRVAPTNNMQFTGGFSFDESLVFVHEDINHAFNANFPTRVDYCDFDIFYTSALPGEPVKPAQIHLPGNQMFLEPSPEGNRICYSNFENNQYELRVVSFDIEVDIYNDLGGILIDNSGANLIVPPGALLENFTVKISTPFSVGEEAVLPEGESRFFAMRLLDAEGIDNPQFIEPMTLTIRYTDNEVADLDEGMLEVYYYDETDPEHPAWVPLGGVVDAEHNEITLEIRHFSKYAIGPASKR
jgi:hypothetical protein